MRTSKEMADLVFQIRDSAIERKKSKHKRIMYVVKYAAPAAACFGLAITIAVGYLVKYSNMPDVEVQPIKTVISDSTDTTVSDNRKTSSTTVVTSDRPVSGTVKTDISLSENIVSEEYAEHDTQTYDTTVSAENPPVHTEEKPKPAETQATAVTKPPVQTVTEVTTYYIDDGEFTPHTMPHLLASDDPITVFRKIIFDGKEYEGYRYINGLRQFDILWTEETELTTYVARRETDVTEPVTIYGIRNRDDEQKYMIVKFINYNIYALYWAVEGEDEQPTDSE